MSKNHFLKSLAPGAGLSFLHQRVQARLTRHLLMMEQSYYKRIHPLRLLIITDNNFVQETDSLQKTISYPPRIISIPTRRGGYIYKLRRVYL